MLVKGILHPQILSLLARIRHSNALVIADRGFPFWAMIETVDISLVDGIPTVPQVIEAVRHHAQFGQAYMAKEFLVSNPSTVHETFTKVLNGLPLAYEPHEAVFKKRVPGAIGLIRTADTSPYANVILVSA